MLPIVHILWEFVGELFNGKLYNGMELHRFTVKEIGKLTFQSITICKTIINDE